MQEKFYTLFWTWDHRMQWSGDANLSLPAGEAGPYLKSSETFLNEYKCLIDYASQRQIDAVIVAGMLRKSHGGVRAAKKLIDYGRKRGVSVLPSAGTGSYDGFVVQTDDHYCLSSWLERHPQLAAIDPAGKPYTRQNAPALYLCSSKEENQQWLKQGTQWLIDKLEPEGIFLSHGRLEVCHCSSCKRSRDSLEGSDEIFKEFANLTSPMLQAVQGCGGNLMVICASEAVVDRATYTNTIPLQYFASLASFSWELSLQSLKAWPAGNTARRGKHLGQLHHSISEPNSSFGVGDFHRRQLLLDEIRSACRHAHGDSLSGLILNGEMGIHSVSNELNYLGFSAFCRDPQLTWEAFAVQHLSPGFGDPETSYKFLQMLQQSISLHRELVKISGPQERHYLSREAYHLFTEVARVTEAISGESQRRWAWLLGSIAEIVL